MKTLDQLKIGSIAKIIKIETGQGLLKQMSYMGLRLGQEVKVIQNARGPIILARGNTRIALGRGMSHKIYVEVKSDETSKN